MKYLEPSKESVQPEPELGPQHRNRFASTFAVNDTDAPLRFASEAEVITWNATVETLRSGGEVWQSREYALTKRFQGYVDRYVVGNSFPATLVLERHVPLLGKWWYVPGGPDAGCVESTLDAAKRLADFARKHGVFLLKIEPRLPKDEATVNHLSQRRFVRAARILPNESTILLDVSGDESEVLSRFSGSTRTKIRKADKAGFSARRVQATEANCRVMYSLLRETSEGRFQLRPYEYYRCFWQAFERTGRGQLVLGYDNNEPVAGMFGTVFGRTSGYKDGASTRRLKLPIGAMYRMQWELILWAREHGATVHDLIGTPPSDRLEDTTHSLHGVGQYKLRLSKTVTDYVGVWDLDLRARQAKFWARWGEPVARRLSLKIRKDPYY